MSKTWPESTCVECGLRIPPGQVQYCAKGGLCNWHVPSALREHMSTLSRQHNAMAVIIEDFVSDCDERLRTYGRIALQPNVERIYHNAISFRSDLKKEVSDAPHS